MHRTDERLDAALRSFLTGEAEARAASAVTEAEMTERILPRVAARGPRRGPMLLVAATLLLGGAVGIAAAVGSGLIRLPAPSDGPVVPDRPAHLVGAACDEPVTATSGFVLEYASLNWSIRASIHADGRVIDGPGQFAPDSTVTERRLTKSGVATVVAAVTESGLATRCRTTLPGPNLRDGWLTVVTDAGPLGLAWGPMQHPVRAMSAKEEGALALLAERLANLDAWLPPDAWIDGSPRSWVSEEWAVLVFRDPVPSTSASGLPEASEIGLADGTRLLDLPGRGDETGCAMVAHDSALDLVRTLDRQGASRPHGQPATWVLSDQSHEVYVHIIGMRPESRTAGQNQLMRPLRPRRPPRRPYCPRTPRRAASSVRQLRVGF